MKKVRMLAGLAALTPAALVLAPQAAQAATRSVSCSAAPHHWTVFQAEFGNVNSIHCFGYNGGTWRGAYSEVSICGGNNYGWYSGESKDGIYAIKHATFHEGTTFATLPDANASYPATISALHISGWKNSDTCTVLR
jgi:hypothetical protein